MFIAEDAAPPLDFYRDYIAHGVLSVDDKRIVNSTADDLNHYKSTPTAAFAHVPPPTTPTTTPVVYGGISQREMAWLSATPRQLTFLSYHFVFRHSGLPAGIGDFSRRLADIFADSQDWHQLDHYTAAFIVLDGSKPIAVILQQHNDMRTYLIGDAPFLAGE